ncbi:MAG: hypothetical protein U5L96_10715 [Owenweeksia sp.]|nr:hypothetical protein [Owenweeksia sp.]
MTSRFPRYLSPPNITPDPETGIGNLSDGELYRMLRYNINHNGRACVDFMPFVNMSEEDIHSVIAYLRAQEPVKNASPETEYTFLGKMVHVMGAIKPGLPEKPVPQKARKEPTAEYGSYLAYSVANCRAVIPTGIFKPGNTLVKNMPVVLKWARIIPQAVTLLFRPISPLILKPE